MASKSELQEIIRRASMSSAEVPATGLEYDTTVKLGLCLATELRDLHRRGEFHGRVSPAAIHLVAQRAEWIDWQDVPEPHQAFVAPEGDDESITGVGLDVFGFGATMAALLLGRRPTYSTDGDIEIYRRGIDVGLANVFDAATAPQRLDRFESMDDVVAELTRLLERAELRSGGSPQQRLAPVSANGTDLTPRQSRRNRLALVGKSLPAATAAVAARRWVANATDRVQGAAGTMVETARDWSESRRPVHHEQDLRRRRVFGGVAAAATVLLAVMIVRSADSDLGNFAQLGPAGIGPELGSNDRSFGEVEPTPTTARVVMTWPSVVTPSSNTPGATSGQVGDRSPVAPTTPGTNAPLRPTSPLPSTAPRPSSTIPRQPVTPTPTTATPRSVTGPTPVAPQPSVAPVISPNPRIVNPAPVTTAVRANPAPPVPTPPPTTLPRTTPPPTTLPRITTPPATTAAPPTTTPAPQPPVTVDALRPPPPGPVTTVDAVVHGAPPPTTVDAVRRP